MNRQLLHAAGIAAFLSAGAAVAQSMPSTTQPTAAPSGSSIAAPTTAPSGMAATPNALPSKTDTGTAAFGKLSEKHPGYVTSEDVSKLQGFDFKSADKNNDGKLDATEFNAAWSIYSGSAK